MMNYTRSKTPSMGTPSVYSHVTGRSSAGLKSARSLKSLKTPWYQKAILQDAIIIDIQRGSMLMAFYSVVSKRLILLTACALYDHYACFSFCAFSQLLLLSLTCIVMEWLFLDPHIMGILL